VSTIRDRIQAEMKAKAAADLGYAPAPENWETGAVIKPGENPFKAMGLPNAGVRGFKLEMVAVIKEAIQHLDLKQREVAELTGLSQPDVSKLLRGQLSGFTIDRLLEVFLALGGDLQGKVRIPQGKHPKGTPIVAGSAHLVAI
jgi:predicted XRE-type DNA-binding protein